jgi:hypothetical protein
VFLLNANFKLFYDLLFGTKAGLLSLNYTKSNIQWQEEFSL